ncbi:MFS transporter [bacterium]|nr:MAG: MFS transporter [bacterium]RKZ16478.1 MAG: MFS transporter [bacterium]
MRPSHAWCLYDVGHSAFATTMMAAVLPVWFTTHIAAGLDPDADQARVLATTRWADANAIAMGLTALSAPLLGTLADLGGGRKKLLLIFAILGALCSMFMAVPVAGQWLFLATIYVLGRFAFSSSIVLYDALLPHVAGEGGLDALSARGYALGYLGGGVLLTVQILAIQKPEWFGLADAGLATRLAFVVTGLWWMAFTIPLMRHVSEGTTDRNMDVGPKLIRASFTRLAQTFRDLREHREALKFLVAFWFYNDGIGTIVVMATAFGAEIGISRGHLIGAILAVQFIGFPFALLFGRLAGRIGARNGIMVGLVGYLLICCAAWFVNSARDFWILAVAVAMVQGGCQALSRSLFASMIPADRSGEFFGFYDVSSKFAGVIGPFLLARVAQATGTSRAGVFALVILFLIGIVLLSRVRTPRRAEA